MIDDLHRIRLILIGDEILSGRRQDKHMPQLALDKLAEKAGMKKKEFELVLSGDLLNQCIGSSFSLRNTGIPHLGLYGACSTMAESLLLASMTVAGGFSDRVVAMTSSHFASSERQYRFPLAYGGQRPPSAQWTVTGAGAALVCDDEVGCKRIEAERRALNRCVERFEVNRNVCSL